VVTKASRGPVTTAAITAMSGAPVRAVPVAVSPLRADTVRTVYRG